VERDVQLLSGESFWTPPFFSAVIFHYDNNLGNIAEIIGKAISFSVTTGTAIAGTILSGGALSPVAIGAVGASGFSLGSSLYDLFKNGWEGDINETMKDGVKDIAKGALSGLNKIDDALGFGSPNDDGVVQVAGSGKKDERVPLAPMMIKNASGVVMAQHLGNTLPAKEFSKLAGPNKFIKATQGKHIQLLRHVQDNMAEVSLLKR